MPPLLFKLSYYPLDLAADHIMFHQIWWFENGFVFSTIQKLSTPPVDNSAKLSTVSTGTFLSFLLCFRSAPISGGPGLKKTPDLELWDKVGKKVINRLSTGLDELSTGYQQVINRLSTGWYGLLYEKDGFTIIKSDAPL
jgi:hypothetical protein